MRETINKEVSVVMYYSAKHKESVPYLMHWQNKDYTLGQVDMYHNYMDGKTKQHIFELCDKNSTLWFRLRLNGDNLHWMLEAVHDGNAN